MDHCVCDCISVIGAHEEGKEWLILAHNDASVLFVGGCWGCRGFSARERLASPLTFDFASVQQWDSDIIFLPFSQHTHTDLAGFTAMSGNVSAQEVILFLNYLYSRFDKLLEPHGVHKVRIVHWAPAHTMYVWLQGVGKGCQLRQGPVVLLSDDTAF